MIHQYKSNGYNIVMDVESGAVHVVDDVTYDVIALFEDTEISKIVEQLREGQIIKIIGKYKKWRQVVWKNEEDELCMGWIQNYNLTKFKLTRSARNIKKIKV